MNADMASSAPPPSPSEPAELTSRFASGPCVKDEVSRRFFSGPTQPLRTLPCAGWRVACGPYAAISRSSQTKPVSSSSLRPRSWLAPCKLTCIIACVLLAFAYTEVMGKYSTSAFELHDALVRALRADTADECAKLLSDVPGHFDVFREAMPHAVRGEWPAVTVLVSHWHSLVGDIVKSAADELPQLVQRINDGFGIVTASHQVRREPIQYLDHLIGDVPFSPLIARFGQDIGVGVVAIDAFRMLLPGCPQLNLGMSSGWPDLPAGIDTGRFRRLVDLAIRSMQPPLLRVKDLLGLTNSEVADLFGVSRQAVDQWELSGEVPTARREKLANLLSVGELLDRKLSPGRLPLVARRSADAYGGLTMLEMVASDRHSELREITERAFDWSGTA
jgi:transcriptional regulator with XRE-family HTH domain